MKRPFSRVALFLVLLLAAPASRLSAQIFSGLGDAAPGEDGVSFGLIYGQMSPQTTFRDGGGFDNSRVLGVSVGFWAAKYLGFQVSMMNTNHVGLPATDGRASVVSGRDPRIDTYMIDVIGRMPLMQGGAVTIAPYLALGGGWKSYDFKWDTKGGPDARGLDLTWPSCAGGVEARFGSEHRLGVRGEFRQLNTKMERWGDAL
ncbi:MAG: hypothetical protein EXR95_06255, partial [Gemmatimonadetes bacterium]|nr:hypothetical protein [Gemmatimonadota bacterium]